MRILVVEDDAPLASFLRQGLEAEYYAVDVASDGDDARCLALENDYDLIVLDLNLPKMDGIAVLRAIRPRNRRCTYWYCPDAAESKTGSNPLTRVRTTVWSSRSLTPNCRHGCAR